VLELITWLRELDARFVAAVTSQGPQSDRDARWAGVLGAVALALVGCALVLLPTHSIAQTAAVCVGLLLAVPHLHHLFERVLVALR